MELVFGILVASALTYTHKHQHRKVNKLKYVMLINFFFFIDKYVITQIKKVQYFEILNIEIQ